MFWSKDYLFFQSGPAANFIPFTKPSNEEIQVVRIRNLGKGLTALSQGKCAAAFINLLTFIPSAVVSVGSHHLWIWPILTHLVTACCFHLFYESGSVYKPFHVYWSQTVREGRAKSCDEYILSESDTELSGSLCCKCSTSQKPQRRRPLQCKPTEPKCNADQEQRVTTCR